MDKSTIISTLDRVSENLEKIDAATFSPAAKLRVLNELTTIMSVMGSILLFYPDLCDEFIAQRGKAIVEKIINETNDCKRKIALNN